MHPFKFFLNSRKHSYGIILTFLCLFFVLLNITSLSFPLKASLTYDETYHYQSAKAILSGQPSKRGETNIDDRNIMPANALNFLVSETIKTSISKPLTQSQVIFFGKLATIFVSSVLGIYVFFWARQLYGGGAGLLALCLYVLDPNIIAHSQLFTQDIFGAFGVFLATYYFWNFLKFGGRRNAILSMFTFGIAQITRYTAVYLAPIYLILTLGFYGATILDNIKSKNFKSILLGLKSAIKYTFLLVLTTILVINIGFSFDRTFTKIGDYQFASRGFNSLKESLQILRNLPIPVPYSYFRGLDMGKYKQETAFGNQPTYLMGKLGLENGKKIGEGAYFFIAFLYKVPIATQLILFIATICLFRFRRKSFWQNEAFLIVPSLFYFVALSFSSAQIGVRYVLMIFPFLFVFCGQAVINWTKWVTQYKIFIISLVSYLLISNLSYFPHYLSYFSEFLLDRKMSYTILADSNLDWGQNQNYLQQYLEKNPDSLYVAYERIGGIFDDPERQIARDSRGFVNPQKFHGKMVVVTANQLVGVTTDPKHFQWLREHQKPIDHIAYSYLVFKIQPQDLPFLLNSTSRR
jgi:Dolichyl-phosphate-mannose-protein mannosyltransferase